MLTVNRVMVAGNLTRDPVIRRTQTGTAVGDLRLAVNERVTNAQGEQREQVCFLDVEVWGKQAEACGEYLNKGAPAFIEGRLQTSQWADKQTGEKRSRLRIRADRVQFLGPAPATTQPAPRA